MFRNFLSVTAASMALLGAADLALAAAAPASDLPSWRPPSNRFVGESDRFAAGIFAKQLEPLTKLKPVTDEMLRNPSPNDWLQWRRTYDGMGFSPLNQINRENVAGLQLVWSWSLSNGATEETPIVHDGVIFIHSFGDRVEALDATNGTLLWEYAHELPKDVRPSPKKGMSITGDMLIVPMSDEHLVALNIKNGKVMWNHQVADPKEKWSYTGVPIVVNGKVIMGMSGCGAGQKGGCFISAHDVKDGKELWRFNTVAHPGDPGGDTWNGLPLGDRYGGSVWTGGSYDPKFNLVYFGVGQPYPWNALVRGTSPQKPGLNNDSLYTNSTLALNPETGKLVWHFQHLANDSWDMDYVFERVLVDLPVEGKTRKISVTSGKMAIFEGLDAETGEFVFARDLGLQTIVGGVDPETGKKTINRDALPTLDKTTFACPFPGGARSWPATAYNPNTKTLFVPLQESCGDFTPTPMKTGEEYVGGAAQKLFLKPSPKNDGNVGRLDAINLQTLDTVWSMHERAPQSSAALPTAGGIVFEGNWDRYFRAYDDRTGKMLWQARLNDVPNSFPVTYSVNGKQYVAVAVGAGGAYEVTWDNLLPDIRSPINGGAALWVFALPDRTP